MNFSARAVTERVVQRWKFALTYGDRIGGRKGLQSGYLAGPLGGKRKKIASMSTVKRRVEEEKRKAGGLKRAALDQVDTAEAPVPRSKKKSRSEKKSEPEKNAGFAPDKHVSFAPPERLAQVLTQPAVSQQQALQLMSDARARAVEIGKLPLPAARARALSALMSELTDRMLAAAGKSHAPGWSVASRKLAVIALSHAHGTLTTAARSGKADVVAAELELIAEHIADPQMLREYWQVEILEIVVVNVLATCQLLHARRFPEAAEQARATLKSLGEGVVPSSELANALENMMAQWADLDADLERLSVESRSLITEVARQIVRA